MKLSPSSFILRVCEHDNQLQSCISNCFCVQFFNDLMKAKKITNMENFTRLSMHVKIPNKYAVTIY